MITIKKAGLEDLKDAAILFDAYRVFYKKASDLAKGKAFLQERLERGESILYIACTAQGKAVGFTQLYPLFSSTRMQRLWLLNDLFVSPAFRGKGISKQLIEQAKDLCRETDACSLCLETGKDNNIGNQLYPRTGFELDEDHNYYEWVTD